MQTMKMNHVFAAEYFYLLIIEFCRVILICKSGELIMKHVSFAAEYFYFYRVFRDSK